MLNVARHTSGMTQAAFARALGTSPSRFSTYCTGKVTPSATFFIRAARIAASLEAAHQRGWMTSERTARAITDALISEDELWAFKMALQGRDHLRELLAAAPDIAGAWEAEPSTTGSPRWDTLLAALASHEFTDGGLAAPAWTRDRRLDDPWILDSPRLTDQQVRARTPEWLAAANIFITERDLTTL